jgi:hypothetical protein
MLQVDQGLDLQELTPKTSYLRDYIQASKAQGVYGVENFLYPQIYVQDVDMTDVAVQADVLQLGTDVSDIEHYQLHYCSTACAVVAQ